MKHLQHTLVDKVTPHSFGGETFYTLDIACIKPTFTEPTIGEHDFNTCEDCQKKLQTISEQIERKFATFPNCCENHRQLLKDKWFKKEDYKDIGKLVSSKVVYTQQHILNNINKDNWYQDITDYIEYTVHSFGQFKYSGGLYLTDYLNYVDRFLLGNEDAFTAVKTKQLMDYLLSFNKPEQSNSTDFNILLATYERWLKLMPFEISFFSSAKKQFQKDLPLLREKPSYNPYLGTSRSRMHTKSSLFDLLLVRTNVLLTSVNTYVLNKEGLLRDIDKIRLEIALEERRNKLQLGYINNTNDEDAKFRKILKEWFRDEKKFIDDITPSLKQKVDDKTANTQTEKSKARILKEEFEKIDFLTLPKIKGKLSEANIDSLFELLSKSKTPYQIAMLNYLGFLDLLFETTSKEKAYELLSTILKAKQRVVKGNCLVLNPKSEESRITYTSHLHSKEVEKDYQNIKLG